MAVKLNQIIAIEKGVKSRAYGELTTLNKTILHKDAFTGMNRVYQPLDAEDTEVLPSERKRVQVSASDILKQVEVALSDLFDLTAKKDWTNCVAKANVVVDGKELLTSAPVSHLLFLEKQLTDMRTFMGNMPILDDAENWTLDPSSGTYRSEEVRTHRTKKITKPIVLYPATEQHPAQTQMVQEDVISGHWAQTKFSGAMTKPDRDAIAVRVEKLLRGVKQAREAANMQEETATPAVGGKVFNYLFKGEIV